MNATVFLKALVIAGIATALPAVADTNAPPRISSDPAEIQWSPSMSDFLGGQLDIQPPGPGLRFTPAGPAPMRPDLRSYYDRQLQFNLIQPPRVSSDPFTRTFNSWFDPAVYHVGRTATVSCSLLTAIQRKNPLCLLNCRFLELTW